MEVREGEGVLGLAPVSLGLIAASIVGRSKNLEGNSFEQGQLL